MQPQRDNRGGVRVVENAKHATVFAKSIFSEVDAGRVCRNFGRYGDRRTQ
jgi:hypothetical protein